MTGSRLICFLLAGLAAALFTAGCSPQTGQDVSTPKAAAEAKPLPAFQTELLEVAFDTASAIPVYPHIKDRSKAQAAAVTAALGLQQPDLASRWIEKIENWRRGEASAELALYWAQHGRPEEAKKWVAEAARFEKTAEDWRRDRIRVAIACVHACLGNAEEAHRLESGVEPSESGKVGRVAAMQSDPEAFDKEVRALDTLIATNNFDAVRNAVESYAELFDNFYARAERRSLIETKIRASWKPLPLFIRFDLLMRLTEAAMKHSDPARALDLVNEAQQLVDDAHWSLDYRIPLAARLAAARFRAGDTTRARTDADAARTLFETEGRKIVDIDRAETLRPLAEAYQAMGDSAAAKAVYTMALREGAVNPNARPRAEDLSATCLSMAVHEVEPDATLWALIREIRAGLGQPW